MSRRNPPVEHQFKPGQSGNPGGRPKGSVNLSGRIRKILLEERDGKVLGDVLAEQLVAAALRNPEKMFLFLREFMDRDEGRTDGKNVQSDANPSDIAAEIRAHLAMMDETIPESEPEIIEAEVEPVDPLAIEGEA